MLPRTSRQARQSGASRCQTLAFTSGKGGVGKTTLCVNLAIALAERGLAVTVLDADLGLANVDVMLGLTPARTIEHFFREGGSLSALAVEGPAGVRVVPAGSGLPELTSLAATDLLRFVDGLRELQAENDFVLIDMPAGIGDQASRIALLADTVMMVTWPEPTAMVDAYAALKVLHRRLPAPAVGLIVNGVSDAEEAIQVHRRLETVAQRFLGRSIEMHGFVPRDEAMVSASRSQTPVILKNPRSHASRQILRLAQHVAGIAQDSRCTPFGEACARKELETEVLH